MSSDNPNVQWMEYAGRDPISLGLALWPSWQLYDQQREIVESVATDNETFVVAGNELGKDFVASFICTTFFLMPQLYFPIEYVREIESQKSVANPYPHTVRILTTSIRDPHLAVLWGEIGRFIINAREDTYLGPLTAERGGPLVMNYRHIRKWYGDKPDTVSYLKGEVWGAQEGGAGHHAAYTLLVIDEASGIADSVYDQGITWAKRMLVFGNPNPTENFFKRAVKGGNLKVPA